MIYILTGIAFVGWFICLVGWGIALKNLRIANRSNMYLLSRVQKVREQAKQVLAKVDL